MKLSHGKEKDFHCNIRSHGAFFQKFFKDCSLNDIGDKKINVTRVNSSFRLLDTNRDLIKNETLLSEFIETVLTKVVIFDNRVFDRFKGYTSDKKKKVFNEQLKLYVFEEKESEFTNFIEYQEMQNTHFLVIHLSFIESMGYKEDQIENFLTDKLNNCFDRNNFIFVLTTGRGRNDWRDSIKELKYRKSTIFKPIEAILDCVENGISYNDHFDIKYHLIKTLFGS